jgi:hypothetical protein
VTAASRRGSRKTERDKYLSLSFLRLNATRTTRGEMAPGLALKIQTERANGIDRATTRCLVPIARIRVELITRIRVSCNGNVENGRPAFLTFASFLSR